MKDQYPIDEGNAQTEETFPYDDSLFVNLSEAELKKFEGTYFDREEKQYWKVQFQNDTLYCKGGPLPEDIKLHPVGKKSFKIKETPYDISVNFRENDHNEPVLEFRIPDIMWLWLVKVKEVNTSDYLGSYYNDELDAQYDLVKKDDEL